jgi:ubiquinone/menaquinone biosynthesis C-methylase UbiE
MVCGLGCQEECRQVFFTVEYLCNSLYDAPLMSHSEAETKVKGFYETAGWESDSKGITLDSQLWEDLRPAASEYVSRCRKKLLKHLPQSGEFILDAASGPVQYPEYLEYSKNFKKRYCVDISSKALEKAKKKLGDHGEYHCASLLDLPFKDNYFDAVLSLHTIYHIDKDQQEQAVRQLLRVSKPGVPVVIVYSNPDRFLAVAKRTLLFKKARQNDSKSDLYFFAHPLGWWSRFGDVAQVSIFPWRSMTASDSTKFIPDNSFGKLLFKTILKAEETMPSLATRLGAYPIVVLQKR